MKSFLISVFSFLFVTQLNATPLDDYLSTLDIVKTQFKGRYGAEELKKKNFGWTIDSEIKKYQDIGKYAGASLTTENAQMLVQNFFRSMRDYHVIVYKNDWSGKYLPFNVKEFNGKAYVVAILDPTLVGDMKVGDEVISMDNQSVTSFVDQIATPYIYQFNRLRERFWSSSWITKRYVALLTPQPTSIETELVLKHYKDLKPYIQKVKWLDIPTSLMMKTFQTQETEKPFYKNIPAVLQNTGAGIPENINPFSGKQSYFSPDVNTIWDNQATKKYFHAWITVLPNKQKLGVIRVNSFRPGGASKDDYKAAIVEFESLVQKMATDSDKLVLDMLGNMGGMLDYGYTMVSYFIPSKVKTLDFRYRMFSNIIQGNEENKKEIAAIRALKTQADVETFFEGDHYYGFPVDLDFANEYADYMQNFVNAVDAGQLFSKKFHYSAGYIKPNPRVRYLKPLYVLVDESSMSCGDMIPALFQDIKRAKIIGRNTAGAGAFVGQDVIAKNPLNLDGMAIPFALAYRYDGSFIENSGVKPSIKIDLTPEDFQTGFVNFRNKVFAAVKN